MSARGDIDTSVSALPGRPVPTFFSTPTQVILRAQVEPAAEALVRGDVLELRLSIRVGLDSFYLLMYAVNIERIVEERGPARHPAWTVSPLHFDRHRSEMLRCRFQLINLTRGPFSQVRVIYSKEELRILLIPARVGCSSGMPGV